MGKYDNVEIYVNPHFSIDHQSEVIHTLAASDLRGIGRGLGIGTVFTVCDDSFFIAWGC